MELDNQVDLRELTPYACIDPLCLNEIESSLTILFPFPHGKTAFIAGIDNGLFESSFFIDECNLLRNNHLILLLFEKALLYTGSEEFQNKLHHKLEKGNLKHLFWITSQVSSLTYDFVLNYFQKSLESGS